MSAVEFRVLGAVEALRAGARLSLGGPRPRAVLARLLLAHGHWVSLDALVDAVWSDAPPATAVKTVQKYVSYLRAGLGEPDLIISRPDGYELATENVELMAELSAALDELPTRLRTVVILKDVYGLSHEAIAEELGISVTAAKVRLHRGRKRMRDLLYEEAGRHADAV